MRMGKNEMNHKHYTLNIPFNSLHLRANFASVCRNNNCITMKKDTCYEASLISFCIPMHYILTCFPFSTVEHKVQLTLFLLSGWQACEAFIFLLHHGNKYPSTRVDRGYKKNSKLSYLRGKEMKLTYEQTVICTIHTNRIQTMQMEKRKKNRDECVRVRWWLHCATGCHTRHSCEFVTSVLNVLNLTFKLKLV